MLNVLLLKIKYIRQYALYIYLYEFSVFSPFSILYYRLEFKRLLFTFTIFYADTIFGEMYMVPRNQMRISN